jgi:hypothetical protein
VDWGIGGAVEASEQGFSSSRHKSHQLNFVMHAFANTFPSFVLIFTTLTDVRSCTVPGFVEVEDTTTSFIAVDRENWSNLLDDALCWLSR